MHKYSQEERQFFKEFVSGHSHAEILEEFNKKFDENLNLLQVKGYLANNKLNTGRTGRFEKGHIPANKGTHIGGWEPTQFKKGMIPHNIMEVGTEIMKSDGCIWVKIAEPNKWKQKHRLIWEQTNGAIPKNSVVIFADKDRTNCSLDNLLLISKRQFVRMNQNGLIQPNKDATKTGIIIADLIIKTAEVKKNKKYKKEK